MNGIIKKPDMDGYGGVIVGDDGKEYYLHQSEFINPNRAKHMKAGMNVTFDYIDNGYEMPRAINIVMHSKGRYVVTVVMDMSCDKPYPADRAKTFALACEKTLERYKNEIENQGGSMDFDVIASTREKLI